MTPLHYDLDCIALQEKDIVYISAIAAREVSIFNQKSMPKNIQAPLYYDWSISWIILTCSK